MSKVRKRETTQREEFDPSGGEKQPGEKPSHTTRIEDDDIPEMGELSLDLRGVSDGRFGKTVIQSGLASADAVKASLETAKQAQALGLRKRLAEVMVEKGILTINQARAVLAAAAKGDQGGLLAGYQLLEKLGEGGMGTVYKARQVSLDRLVALKILPDQLASNPEFLGRFEREAKIAAKLSHPNLVGAIDVGMAGGKYYFAMEYIDGKSVKDLLAERIKIPESEAVSIMIQMTKALEYAWRQGMVHRDVKPDNMLLTNEGVAKLADLGLAKQLETADETKLTRAGAGVGTPHYVAPEQALGEKVDIRADIYSLGVTFYEMVTGQLPFTGEDAMAIIAGRFKGTATPAAGINPEVSREVSNIIGIMMARKVKNRYPSPRVLLRDLLLVASGQSPEFASPSKSTRMRAVRAADVMKTDTSFFYVRPKRRRLTALLIGLGAVAALAASAWAVVLLKPGARESGAPAFRRGRSASSSADEIDAACREVRELIEKGQIVQAVTRAAQLAARHTGGPGAERFEALRIEASLKLDERRALETEEKKYRSLVSEAEKELASRDYRTALALLAQARGISPGAEVEKLLSETRRVQFLSRAKEAEKDGDLAGAIDLYMQVIKIEEDQALQAHVEELERREQLGELRAEAQAFRGAGKWEEARAKSAEGLRLARGDERRSLEEIVAECDSEIFFLGLLGNGERAAAAGEWKKALDLAEKALSMKPEDARSLGLKARAKKALGPAKRIRDSIGMEFVLVPAGEFSMGSENGDEDERPVHDVCLDAYYIGKHEVTNAQFELFSPAHKGKRKNFSAGDDMPVIAVTWDEAMAFCRWLSRRERAEYRLPTEAEWEKAARGPSTRARGRPEHGRTGGTGGRVYPWGNEEPGEGGERRCNFAPSKAREDWKRDGFEFASPVGSFPKGASPFGVLDMAGNVWEWCLDWYHKSWYEVPGQKNTKGPETGTERVIRGGSFTSRAGALRCANRMAKSPGSYDAILGFRCVRAVRVEEGPATSGTGDVGR